MIRAGNPVNFRWASSVIVLTFRGTNWRIDEAALAVDEKAAGWVGGQQDGSDWSEQKGGGGG